MNNVFQAAIILTAVDRMSQVVARATRASEQSLQGLADKASKLSVEGMGFLGAGSAGFALLSRPIGAFTKLEASAASLQGQMLEAGGTTSKYFEGLNQLAIVLGNKLPGTTADMQGMFEMLLRNGTAAEDILNGVGKSAAYTALALKMPYEAAAEFAAQLKISTGVASADMEKFMDVIVRTRSLGVDPREMSYAFGRAGLKQFGIGGLEDAKAMSALFSTIIPITKSGETAGSGMSRLITALFDVDKMKEANAALAQYGIHWDFIDQKTGKFKGVENLVGQLGQLSKLNDAQRLQVLQGIFGDGEDRKIAAIIATNGVAGYNKAVERMAAQGTLNQKVEIQAGTVANQWEAALGTIENAWAAIGKTFAPELKTLIGWLNAGAAALQGWAQMHPKLFKFIGLFVGVASAMATVLGVLKLMRAAMLMFNIVAAANPFVLIFMAIAAVALLVYTYWDDIAAFFMRIWAKITAGAKAIGLDKLFISIKNLVVNTFQFIWKVVTNFTPLGLIIKHWSKITAFFGQVWTIIKGHFTAVWDWVSGLGDKFWNAGVNIIKMLIGGITSMIDKAGDAISKVTQKVRNFLPFSPAKEGPLRDLHRIRLVETIAATIVPAPLVKAMQGAVSGLFGPLQRQPALAPVSAGSGGGGTVTVNYSPTINVTGGDATGFADMLRQHKEEIARLVQDAMQRQKRTTF